MSDVLVLNQVCKSFGRRPVVKNVSFSVKEGEIFGFLGPNGAGKTTTIKMILGLLSIDSGSRSSTARRIAFCPAESASKARKIRFA